MHSPSVFQPPGSGFGLVVVASDARESVLHQAGADLVPGWQMHSVDSTEEALAHALQGASRLLLVDLDSSSFDGFDLLALVRSHERTSLSASLPAVACAAEVSDLLQAKCVLEGFHLVVAKSATADEVRERVTQMLLGRAQGAASALTPDRERIERFLHPLTLDSSAGQLRSALTGIRLAFQGEMLRLTHDAALSIARLPQQAGERERIAAIGADMARHSLSIGCARMAALADDLAREAGAGMEERALMLRLVELRDELGRVLLVLDSMTAAREGDELG